MTTATATRKPAALSATADHAHRWRLTEPSGPASEASCRICGANRLFPNSIQGADATWTEREFAA